MGLTPEEIWDNLVVYFGNGLANPEHEPKRFFWQCKIYKYINDQKSKNNSQKEEI